MHVYRDGDFSMNGDDNRTEHTKPGRWHKMIDNSVHVSIIHKGNSINGVCPTLCRFPGKQRGEQGQARIGRDRSHVEIKIKGKNGRK